ncbi:hypothetical protein J2T17_006135 [Paenibacillus mucilaginosus]
MAEVNVPDNGPLPVSRAEPTDGAGQKLESRDTMYPVAAACLRER